MTESVKLRCSLCCISSQNVRSIEEFDIGPGVARWIAYACPGCQRHILRKPERKSRQSEPTAEVNSSPEDAVV